MAAIEPGTDFTPELREARLGELDRSCLAVGRAREALGWQARTRIAEGLRLTYDATATH
jgi:UDP-glucose 4-epimerase